MYTPSHNFFVVFGILILSLYNYSLLNIIFIKSASKIVFLLYNFGCVGMRMEEIQRVYHHRQDVPWVVCFVRQDKWDLHVS